MKQKIALVTGGTGGIGKATALALAKQQVSVHFLGRNSVKGEQVLQELNATNTSGDHRFYECDLSSTHTVHQFLIQYVKNNNSLDYLVLNAGIFPNQSSLSVDGIDLSFSIGFVSRYLFSKHLDKLLNQLPSGKVLHVCGSMIGKLDYSYLKKPSKIKIKSVWQTSLGCGFMTYHWQKVQKSKTIHIHWNPGVVNTQTVKGQSKFIQILSGFAGMIEPEQAGSQIADTLLSIEVKSNFGLFFSKGKPTKPPKKLDDLVEFNNLQVFINDL